MCLDYINSLLSLNYLKKKNSSYLDNIKGIKKNPEYDIKC